jgi:hypothetical protein
MIRNPQAAQISLRTVEVGGDIADMDFDDRERDVETRASIGSRTEVKMIPATGEDRRFESRAWP